MAPNAEPIALENHADTNGFNTINDDNENWTRVEHSARKKRDRLLDDGVLFKLMTKSDSRGLQRLFLNLSIMASTAYALLSLGVVPSVVDSNWEGLTRDKLLMFAPLYFFYGFQFQCFAFAGQHEFLHRNAFKSKWINNLCLFYTGVFCFEFGEHERVMHKQHHSHTNNKDKDPELTSYHSREVLDNPEFRNVPLSRWDYIRQFLDIPNSLKVRLGRVFFSAIGVAVDYSGTGWSLEEQFFSGSNGIMKDLQRTAIVQILHWVALFVFFGQTQEGRIGLFFWWIVPVLCGYPVVNYFRNLEHADCEVSNESNCLRNTRSCRSNLLIRVLLWDTNFHAEHHCYPMVPFFNLHKLNELMYDSILHNEINHFTLTNITAFKPGGWIDQQSRDMAEFISKKKLGKSE